MDKKNLAVVRQQFAQCVFTHKVLEKATERLKKGNTLIKWLNSFILLAVLVFLVLPFIFPDKNIYQYLAIFITIFEIFFLFIQKEFSFEERSGEYKKTAIEFLNLRDEYELLMVDIINNLDNKSMLLRRNLLQKQYCIVSNLSPQSIKKDYKKAWISLFGVERKNIFKGLIEKIFNSYQKGEEYTWLDDEIDLFLSKELKLKTLENK